MLRNRCAITSQSLRKRFAITLQSLRDRCANAAQALRNHFAIAAQTLRNRCAIAAQMLHNPFESAVELLGNRSGFVLKSLRDHSAIAALSLRYHCCGIAAELLRNCCGIAAELLCNHCTIASELPRNIARQCLTHIVYLLYPRFVHYRAKNFCNMHHKHSFYLVFRGRVELTDENKALYGETNSDEMLRDVRSMYLQFIGQDAMYFEQNHNFAGMCFNVAQRIGQDAAMDALLAPDMTLPQLREKIPKLSKRVNHWI
jgi:hypothetical protein